MPTDDQTLTTRRGFFARLTGLAAGAGLLAAGPAETQAQPAAEAKEGQQQPESRGYQETEHVRAYYRSARF